MHATRSLIIAGSLLGLTSLTIAFQQGLKIGQIKPKLGSAGAIMAPKVNSKNIRLITKPEITQAIEAATQTKVQSLTQSYLFTPTNPAPNGASSVVSNCFMSVAMNGGNWVFRELGVVMCGVKVPSGSKYALITANGSWSVKCKSVSITSGSTSSILTYSDSLPEEFHHVMVVDVQGKKDFGFSVTPDANGQMIWLGSIEVHFSN